MKSIGISKRFFLCFLASFLAFLLLSTFLNFLQNPSPQNPTENQIAQTQNSNQNSLRPMQLLRVIDGDTLEIKLDGEKKHLRLVGLNTPEARNFGDRVKECFGEEASQKTKAILSEAEELYFEPHTTTYDKFGRLLGYVFYKKKGEEKLRNLAEEVIKAGYGYEYTYHGQKYKYQKEFKNAERLAREQKLGLWAPGACED